MSLERRVPGIQMRIAAGQKAWREQGRLMAYCSMSSGFGAWLKGMVSAYAISLLTERALLLNWHQCPVAGAGHVGSYIADYFEGRGFDWNARHAAIGVGVRVAKVHLNPRSGEFNRTHAGGTSLSHRTLLEVHAGEHAGPDKVMRNEANKRRLSATFAWDASPQDTWAELHWSAFDLLLNPSRRLSALAAAFFAQHAMKGVEGGGPPMFVALHARLGDGEMNAPRTAALRSDMVSAATAASYASELRPSAMRTDPLGALSCFDQLGAGARLLITDSVEARDCAVRNGVLTTEGRAVHLGSAHTFPREHIDKVMLDWWLLASATEAGTLDHSTFLETARWRHHGRSPVIFRQGCNRSSAYQAPCDVSRVVRAG